MLKKLRLLIVALCCFPFAADAASDPAAEEFYKGKTIRFIVGFTAGGGFDVYARTISRHIGKHLPGKPTTIVDNMPGAGSLIAANYIYNQAKADGLTIGHWIGGLIVQQVIKASEGIKFDALDINPLSGDDVAKIVASFFELRPDIVAKLTEILAPRKR